MTALEPDTQPNLAGTDDILKSKDGTLYISTHVHPQQAFPPGDGGKCTDIQVCSRPAEEEA